MTIDEFIERLRQTPRDWMVRVPDGAIRRGKNCCPISACHPKGAKSGAFYSGAAQLLGLGIYDREAIAQAADGYGRDDFKPLRARLLDACGLKGQP